MKKVLLTGGSGFLGQALLSHHALDNVISVGRTRPKGVSNHVFCELGMAQDYSAALKTVDVVVHAAGRAHVMNESSKTADGLYREVNTLSTLRLAEQAAEAGVQRFIYISTIKVLGEKTIGSNRFSHDSDPSPCDYYSTSKFEAEVGLKDLCLQSNMEYVIIRPPLIYGPGVKGNFASLLSVVSLPLPLPLAGIQNSRSLVSVENVVDLIVTCVDAPAAKNQTFLVSDDDDMSTSELMIMIAKAKQRKLIMFPMPKFLMRLGLAIVGRGSMYERLYSSMRVDISHTKNQLGWYPKTNVAEGMRKIFSEEYKGGQS